MPTPGPSVPGTDGRRDRRPRPAAGRPRPRRTRRQRRRPDPPAVREADPGRQQVGARPRRLRRVLARPGFAGVLAFTLPEALWLAGDDYRDNDWSSPTRPPTARRCASSPRRPRRAGSRSWSTPPRSSTSSTSRDRRPAPPGARLHRTRRVAAPRRRAACGSAPGARPCAPPDGGALARQEIVARPRFVLAGLMAYEAQIAGVGRLICPAALTVWPCGRCSGRRPRELAERRAAAVAAVAAVAPLEFVNGGGTGSGATPRRRRR